MELAKPFLAKGSARDLRVASRYACGCAPLYGARALWYNTRRQFKICSVLRYRWTRLKPGKFYARVHEARDAPAMGAFPFVSLAGFSRAPTESRTGIVPSSFPARETKAKRGKEKRKR